MKKQSVSVLLTITFVFAAFTIGLYLGRNQSRSDIHISGIAAQARHTAPVINPVSEERPVETEPLSFPLNINTATAAELTALPGIGEMLAQRIVDYRSANGSFSAPEELLNVDGIGTGKLEAILNFITTGG